MPTTRDEKPADDVFNGDVFAYIEREVNAWRTERVPLDDQWDWNMAEHISKTVLYKNSKFAKGKNDGSRPFRNIVVPILNVAYRSEGFDVKDIEPFVDDKDNYYKSFLVRKYHGRWARAHSIDTFIDETVEGYVDFGLALTKNVNKERPENVPLQTIAFCDQTDVLSGPLCLRHEYSVDQLAAMEAQHWYPDEIERAIAAAKAKKSQPAGTGKDGKDVKTPGKYIEVYELHGVLPASWLAKEAGDEYEDSGEYVRQAHYVTFYTDQDNRKKGICLYKGREKDQIFKAIKRDGVFGRACGRGAVEELFEPQLWINYSELRFKAMLDAAAKVAWQTADQTFAAKNGANLNAMEDGAILIHEDGKPLNPVAASIPNQSLFDAKAKEWEEHARKMGSASEAAMGTAPSAGTPFALQDLVVAEGRGMHEYRQGKLAVYIAEIYRDWVLPFLADDLNKGQRFLEELNADELQLVMENVVNAEVNAKVKAYMLPTDGSKARVMRRDERDAAAALVREQFMAAGSKRFLEVLERELEDLPIDVAINVAGKQAYQARNVTVLSNIFRQIMAAPEITQNKGMMDILNQIIEASGFSPVSFGALTNPEASTASEAIRKASPEAATATAPAPAA